MSMELVQNIYSNNDFAIAYDEKINAFHLKYATESLELRFCELMALKRKIYAIDIIGMFDASNPDLEIITLSGCNRILVLSLEHILQLRDLLSGTFTMLELNHVLHESLFLK